MTGLGAGINDTISDLINRAAAVIPRVDPLTLDLDGDGLETVGIDPESPILFDHDGDGVKTATGWVQSDDGFLVLDRNGNGTIDTGAELFGDSTPLYSGGFAADGFAALAQEDTNFDGRVDANDARFNDLRIWRDLNQNGISEANELFTLQDAGIVSLHTAKTENSTTLANGNQIADLGSFVRADGSHGNLVEIAGDLADIDLIEDTFHSQFSDSIPLTEQAKTLPQMNGSGQVRNLREAASLSTGFTTLLQTYDDAPTREAQQALLDDLVQSWGETSTLAVTGQGAYDGRQVTVVFAGIASGTPEYDAWMDKLNTLERFNGHAYFTNPPAGSGPVILTVFAQSMVLLDQAYAALKDSVYDSLVLQTRLAGIVGGIGLVLDGDSLRLDLSGAEQEMLARIGINPVNGMTDALEFIEYTRTTFDLAAWDVYGFMGEALRAVPDIGTVRNLLNEFGWVNVTVGSNAAGSINGTEAADILLGGAGNDTLNGYAGDDVLHGGAGNDTLKAGDGNDLLIGGSGADRMEGGLGGDTYYVDDVGDTLVEASGAGVDTVNSTVTFSLASNLESLTLLGSAAIDGTGNSLNNILIGNDGDNTLTGGGGDDFLDGGAGFDILKGGSGDDTYIISDLLDSVVESGGNGNDTVKAPISYDLAWVNSIENITLTGTADIDGAGDDGTNILIGNSGRNTLIGLGGSDTLDGGAGADTLIGGTGNDTYVVDDAGDVVIELSGQGTDVIESSVTYAMPDNVENMILTGSAAINGTGNALSNTLTGNDGNNALFGGAGNDTLQGGAGNDVLDGETGNDRLEGGAGNDTYYVDSGSDNVIELPGEGVDLVYASVGFTLDAEVENLTLVEGTAAITGTGNELDNTLIGNSADNTLSGKDGNDYIDGGAGADDMKGGYGDDVFIVDNINDTVTDSASEIIGYTALYEPIYGRLGGIDSVFSSVSFELSTYVENLTLTGTDAINATGNNRDNILAGNSANNTLIGDDGDDYLDGGAGADVMVGGKGNDTYIVDHAGDVVIELSGQGTDIVMSSVTFDLSDTLENLTLTGAADINGTGNNSNNILTGNSGINTLAGKGGNDTYFVQNSDDVVVELANEGTDTVYSTASYVLSENVENLTLTGTNAINATGNASNNILIGNTAANILDGGAGSDTMIGGMGNDTYVINSTGDKITELAGEGIDSVLSSITYTLGAELENLTLTGSVNINGTGTEFDNVLIGNDGNNTLTGKGGNDTLIGGGGADTLAGGSGDDTYIIDDLSDTITESSGNGVDTVISSIGYTLVNNLENLVLTGTGNINGTGNTGNNVLTGNSGNNTLNGLSGNDTLDGGAGADTLIGGTENDTYIVDDSGDVVIEASGAGTDAVQSWISYTLTANVENLTLIGSAHVSATGNTLNNILTGNAGNNVLNGAGGSDTYYGGAGDDIYVIDSTGDKITEFIGEGVDTVLSSITYTLGAELENLTLTGSVNINGTGNGLNNILTGNDGKNTLTGGAGNDTLFGGGGIDTLKGGTGDDTYVVDDGDIVSESSGEGTDTVLSSISYTLTNNVENLTLTGTDALNGTGNTLNNVLTGNDAANTLIGGSGNDTLIGGQGADVLDGGSGNDLYLFGRGDGADSIKDYQTSANTDVLRFGADIYAEQIWFRQSGNDLEVSLIGTQDSVTVKDWYSGSAYHIEQLNLTSGSTLLNSQVQNLVNAMASFTPPAAGQTSLPPSYQDALSGVIAASWQ